jgi:hypothetical protein
MQTNRQIKLSNKKKCFFQSINSPGLVEFGTDGYLRRKSNSIGLISFFINKIWKKKY